MTASTASRPPVGMPPHLWELAKRDAHGAVPERIRQAKDDSDTAPSSIRAIARRAATASATFGVAAAAVALGAGTATAEPTVDLSGFDGAVPPPGQGLADVEGPGGDHGGGAGGGDGGGHGGFGGGASHETHGSLGDGPVSSGLGGSFQVHHGDAPGPQHTLTVSIFQDVNVVETADGNFQVDAYQYIVIRDSQGHEYHFVEHYQVTVPDPPGQETDLMIHETGHVQVVENADGSFTPVAVDHSITVTVGSDGDGRDEIGIRQDESVQVTEHGRPDPHDTTINLGERATTQSHDTGDEATTDVDQTASVGSGRGTPGDQHGLPEGTPATGAPGQAPGGPNGTGTSTTTTGGTPQQPAGTGTSSTGTTGSPAGTAGTTPTTPTTTPATTAPATTIPAASGAGAAGAVGTVAVVPLDPSISPASAPVTTVSFSGPSHAAGQDLDGPPPGAGSFGGHDGSASGPTTGTATGPGQTPVHDQVFTGHGPAAGPVDPFQGGTASAPDAGGTHGPSTTSGAGSTGGTHDTTHDGSGASGNDHDGSGDAVHETNDIDGSGHSGASHEGSGHGDGGHEAASSGHADTGGHDAGGTDGSEHLGHVG
jgi:hypothetical protein